MENRGFYSRGFVSFLTLFGFLIMSITGIVLYIEPYGRVAYWTDWRFIGLSKSDWGNIHIISSLLFLIAGGFHLYYNWRALMNYIFNKVTGGLKLKRELAFSGLISVIIIIGAIYQIPPLRYIIDLNEYIKEKWVVSKEYEPPYGHAELTSLRVFAKKMNIDLEKTLEEFKKQGIVVRNVTDTLKKIAEDNHTSPMNLYIIMKKFEKKAPAKAITYTPDKVEEEFAGSGIGRKRFADLCGELNLDISLIRKRLQDKGIKIKDDETLKKAAARYGINPIEILKAILIENYKPAKMKEA